MAAVDNVPDDFPAERFSVFAFCERCHHYAAIDRARIPAGATMSRVRTLLRCSACGSREAALRIVYPGAGGFRHDGGPMSGAGAGAADASGGRAVGPATAYCVVGSPVGRRMIDNQTEVERDDRTTLRAGADRTPGPL
jgi:hypothetical protein